MLCLVNFPLPLSFPSVWRFWPDFWKGLWARNGVAEGVRWVSISFLMSLSFSCCDFGRFSVNDESYFDDFDSFEPKVEMKSLYTVSLEVCLDLHWSGRFAYLLKQQNLTIYGIRCYALLRTKKIRKNIFKKTYPSTSSFLKRCGPCLVFESSACTFTISDTITSLKDTLLTSKHFSTVKEPDWSTQSSPKCPFSLEKKKLKRQTLKLKNLTEFFTENRR